MHAVQPAAKVSRNKLIDIARAVIMTLRVQLAKTPVTAGVFVVYMHIPCMRTYVMGSAEKLEHAKVTQPGETTKREEEEGEGETDDGLGLLAL